MTVGLLHPGAMGAVVGRELRARGVPVLWASESRSAATAARAADAGLEDAGTVAELVLRSDVILSICPPAAAAEVARGVAGFDGLYVDVNAISPASVRRIADGFPRFVDGGIVGPPPLRAGTSRLFLSGTDAVTVAGLFAGTTLGAVVLSDRIGDASALKMTYAAWTKGTAALLLAIRGVAAETGVEPALLEEWRVSVPELEERSQDAAHSADEKGWRWTYEMEEIAATFAAAGYPEGFHIAAAEMFRRASAGA